MNHDLFHVCIKSFFKTKSHILVLNLRECFPDLNNSTDAEVIRWS